MVAAAIIGSGVIGAGASLFGSSQASSASKDAANKQFQMYQQTRADLSPYNTAGQSAFGNALSLAQGSPTGGGPDYVNLAYQNLPLQMTQNALEQTPGYQFTRDQGLKMVQSAAAARGLGVSGASLKGAATYATGLANTTYKDQFALQQQRFADLLSLNTGQQGNLQNQASRLTELARIGEGAAAQTGTSGTSLANASGNYLNQAGLASAAGTTGVTNAAIGSANALIGYNQSQDFINALKGGSLGGATGGYTPASFANPNTGYTTGGFSGGNVPITG